MRLERQRQRAAEAGAGEGEGQHVQEEQQGNRPPRVVEPWASIENLHKDLKEIPQATCDVCNERWPGMELCRDGSMCTRCFKDNKNITKLMSRVEQHGSADRNHGPRRARGRTRCAPRAVRGGGGAHSQGAGGCYVLSPGPWQHRLPWTHLLSPPGTSIPSRGSCPEGSTR